MQSPPTSLHAIDPLTRYKELLYEFDVRNGWFTDSAWLRYAAQAAAMRPAIASDTVQAIDKAAERLRRQTRWYEFMSTPFSLVVAATLVQTSDTVDEFETYFAATREIMRQEGLHARGKHELVTILALRVLEEKELTSSDRVQRMRHIYDCMKKHHWWLTGAEDLPACALLTTREGSAEAIEAQAEGTYRGLIERGFKQGNLLQVTANIIALAGLPVIQAVDRFDALNEEFRANARPLYPENHPSVALLCLLDHPVARVVERFLEMFHEVDRITPDLIGHVNFNIACDLTYLDLVRFDRQLRPLAGTDDVERVRNLIRRQRAASLMLVDVPPPPPYPIFL